MEFVIFLFMLFFVGYFHFTQDKTSFKKATGHSGQHSSKFKRESKKERIFSEVFNETFLVLAAFVIKSDDDIAQVETDRVRNYFKTYYPLNERQYFEHLHTYLKKDIDISSACQPISNAGFNDKFQMMTQLFNIASADRHIYISEYVALYDIFNLLNLPNLTFITIRNLFDVSFSHREVLDFKERAFRKKMKDWRRGFEKQQEQREKERQREEREKERQEQYKKKQQSYNYYYQKKSKKEPFSKKTSSKLDSAYGILGLNRGASLKQIKRAFRKLAHLHHPDKVAHLGEGAVKQADAIFRKIKDAYELIVRSL